jgi:hypothetical protein
VALSDLPDASKLSRKSHAEVDEGSNPGHLAQRDERDEDEGL